MKPDRLAAAAAILVLACLLMVPALLRPPMIHDSFWIDWVWADQFTDQLRQGNPYPRWLPQSHGGLGSPAFYYYPPLAFYLTGLFGLAGLSTYSSIVAAFFIGLLASGFLMHRWLVETGARSPLLGALLFMALPYHMLDFYGRGALAEFVAIAFVPLVALGVKRAIAGRPLLLAIGYAALILTHLPLALLTSLFLVVPYACWLCRKTPWSLLRLAVPLAVGLAVSAFYLLPALLLDRHRDAEQLWSLATLTTENWSLWRWNVAGPSPEMRSAVAAAMLGLVMPIVLLLFSDQRRWGLYALATCALGAGIVPGFWSLPLLEAVQYPFRLLPIAEFAVATGIARTSLPRLLRAVVIVPALLPSAVFLAVPHTAQDVPFDLVQSRYPDVPENLPPGDRPYSWPSYWALEVADAHPAPIRAGGWTVDPIFYFPAWEVRCEGVAVATRPAPDTQLLSYRGSNCDRRLILTAAEKLGFLLTFLGLAGFALLLLRPPRRPASG